MIFLLDTNAAIALLKGHARFLDKLRACRPGDVGVAAIVKHELCYGAYKGTRVAENLARIDAIRLEVVEMNGEDARHAGEIRAYLAKAGTPIGPYDALIAGQAIARNLTLITHNTREFQRVNGLKLEDWA